MNVHSCLGPIVVVLVTLGCGTGIRDADAVDAPRSGTLLHSPLTLRGVSSETPSVPPESLHLYLRLEVDAVSAIFPRSEGWGFRAYRLMDCTEKTVKLSIFDARQDEGPLLQATVAGEDPTRDVLVAFRVRSASRTSEEQRAEIVVAEIRGSQVTELARATLPAASSPSKEATEGEWLDDHAEFDQSDTDLSVGPSPPFARREDWADYSFQRVEVIHDCVASTTYRVGTISWNGHDSRCLVNVKSPAYDGFYNIVSTMDDATSERTRGLLPTWPEPVWSICVAGSN